MTAVARPADDELALSELVELTQAQAAQVQALQQAIAQLEDRNQLRSQLDVLVAHEVRTPLTVVLGVLETLRLPDMPPDDRRSLIERAIAHADHLSEVVDDLMKPGAAGSPVLARTPMRTCRLDRVMRQAVEAVSRRLDPDRLRVEVDPDTTITTAPSRLVAVIVNLLENAAKYGGAGEVLLTGELTADRMLRITVGDRGPGLQGQPADDLFDAFTRGAVGDQPGRGVGLYLVRMMARSLGGDAQLAEREGGGCLATVELPQRRASDRTEATTTT